MIKQTDANLFYIISNFSPQGLCECFWIIFNELPKKQVCRSVNQQMKNIVASSALFDWLYIQARWIGDVAGSL